MLTAGSRRSSARLPSGESSGTLKIHWKAALASVSPLWCPSNTKFMMVFIADWIMKQRYFVFCRIVALSPSDSAKASLVNRRSILRLIFTTLSRDVARFNVINWRANDSGVMTPLPSKQRARRAKHCPISRGWRLTTDRQSAWMAVVHCRPRSLWRHYECRQVDASTDGIAPYCCLSSPCIAIRWTRSYVYSPLSFSYLTVTSNYCDTAGCC